MSGEFLVAMTASACGLAFGLAFGFAIIAHQRVRAGWRPRTGNRLVRMFFGCDAPRDNREVMFFCGGTLLLVWVLFVVCTLPFAVALAVTGEAPVMGAPVAAAFCLAGLFGHSLGEKLWLRCARAF